MACCHSLRWLREPHRLAFAQVSWFALLHYRHSERFVKFSINKKIVAAVERLVPLCENANIFALQRFVSLCFVRVRVGNNSKYTYRRLYLVGRKMVNVTIYDEAPKLKVNQDTESSAFFRGCCCHKDMHNTHTHSCWYHISLLKLIFSQIIFSISRFRQFNLCNVLFAAHAKLLTFANASPMSEQVSSICQSSLSTGFLSYYTLSLSLSRLSCVWPNLFHCLRYV